MKTVDLEEKIIELTDAIKEWRKSVEMDSNLRGTLSVNTAVLLPQVLNLLMDLGLAGCSSRFSGAVHACSFKIAEARRQDAQEAGLR